MTHKRRVAVLTHDEDPHLPYVTRFLNEEPLVINTGGIPDRGLSFTTVPNGVWPEIFYNGQLIDSIKSVWYRSVDVSRLLPPKELTARIAATLNGEHTMADHYQLLDDISGVPNSEYCDHVFPGSPELQRYMANSLDRLAGALPDVIPDAFWISRRDRLIHADSKPRQLVVATRLGFTVPATCFTSENDRAEAFLREHGRCVVKPLAIRPPTGFNQYTVVLEHGKTPPIQGLNINPHIFQQLIEPDFELRITVAGNEAFASVVTDTREEMSRDRGIRDWRIGSENDTFSAAPYRLSKETEQRCVALSRELGLTSGMIDMIVKDGTEYFLEINGNGQWAFVDDVTVERIGRALASMLERAAL
jgi:hypothetical protein